MWGNLFRMLKVMDFLARPEGVTKKELSEVTGKSERQVYRILDAIQNMGIPVYDDKIDGEREKSWRIEESYLVRLKNLNIPNPDFTLPELFILGFIKSASVIFQDTEISRYADSAFDKLKGFATDELIEVFERMESAFVGRNKFVKSYGGLEEMMMDILDAVISRKKCLIRYNSFKSGIIKKYHIHPLHFFEETGGIYIMARIDASKDVYTFALERIGHIEITDEHFVYPVDFDASAFLNRPFGIIVDDCFDCSIWFSGGVARYIKERKWADDQKINEKPDGSLVLEMQTCGWPDVKKWILSFGRDARVIAPEQMRAEIFEEIRQMAQNYSE